MDIYCSPRFARNYKKLPSTIKEAAKKREKLFRKNMKHPLLETHKLKGIMDGLWAFSITNKYRIVFEIIDNNTIHFHNVGDHTIYE